MVSVEEDDLAGLEDVSSDGEDDNYEAELTDNETASLGTTAVRKPYRKRARDSSETLPLMEGEGRYLRVRGFNQSQRAVFVQILMRYGVGEFDWAEFAPRLKQKTVEEIHEYGKLFLQHICEEINDSPTFSDGVPKEGLRIEDVLVRIGTLTLIRDRLKIFSNGAPLFTDDIISRYPGLKGGRIWKEHHDWLLLRAVMKHGYGRWQAIVDDKDLKIQEVICKELNLAFINTPAPGAPQPQNFASGTSQAHYNPLGTSQQVSATGVPQQHVSAPGISQSQNGVNSEHAEAPGNQAKGITGGGDFVADSAHGSIDTTARSQLFQDQSMLYHFREMQRRQVEFVKKRVLLIEKGLNVDLQKEYFSEEKTHGIPNDEPERKVTDAEIPSSAASDSQIIDQLPRVEMISSEEISAFACDKETDRLQLAKAYNEMSRTVVENVPDSAEAYNRPASLELRKNLGGLEALNDEITQILSQVHLNSKADQKADAEISSCSSIPVADNSIHGMEAMDAENPIKINVAAESFPNGSMDVEMG